VLLISFLVMFGVVAFGKVFFGYRFDFIILFNRTIPGCHTSLSTLFDPSPCQANWLFHPSLCLPLFRLSSRQSFVYLCFPHILHP
jgi:hypothetical protein